MNPGLRSLVVFAGAALAACSGSGDAARKPLLVFAAASLTAPFSAIEKLFEAANPGVDLQCNFAGTPQLVLQIREGAAVDVFASADEANMAKVVADGVAAGEPRRFARNELAIVVVEGNPLGIVALADLARDGRKVALCGPEVPAGRYARMALDKAKVAVQSLSDEPNVKALVTKVQIGELDAGIVYATDCRVQGVVAVAIAAEHQVVADYPIVVCKSGANAAAAAAFVDFVLSREGQRVLADFGFRSP
jgi:molybdate transport system substrate-binding protein